MSLRKTGRNNCHNSLYIAGVAVRTKRIIPKKGFLRAIGP